MERNAALAKKGHAYGGLNKSLRVQRMGRDPPRFGRALRGPPHLAEERSPNETWERRLDGCQESTGPFT